MLRNTEPCWLILLKWRIFAWQIIIVRQFTVLSSFFMLHCDRISKIFDGPSTRMYCAWSQVPPQLHVSFPVFSFFCRVDVTLFSILFHLLSIPPSAFSLYHLCTALAYSLPSSSTLPLIFLHFCACKRFLYIYFLPERSRYRPWRFLLALYDHLSLDSSEVYPAWHMEKAFYCSTTSLILLLV